MAKITLKPLDDGQKSVDIPVGKTTIGRGPFLGCGDKKVSRNHAVLEVTEKGEVFLTPTHVNPCFYQPTAESPGTILKKDKRHKLENGDSFSLLPRAFRYQVVVIGEATENKLEEKPDIKLENNANGSADERKQKEESRTGFVKEEINRIKADCASEDSSRETTNVKEVKPDVIKPKKEQELNGTGSPTLSKENAKVNSSSSGERNSRTLPVWLEKLVDHPNKQEKKKPQTAKLQNREKPSKHKTENSVKRKVTKVYDKSESEEDFEEREIDRPRRNTGRSSRQNRQTRQGLSLEDFIVSDDEEWQSDKAELKLKKRRGRRRGDESGSDWEAEHGKKKRSHKYDSDSESGSDWGASNRRRKTSKIKRRRSKRVAVSEGGSDEEMEEDTSSAVKNSKRIPCTYGKKCYRKNPNHLSQFSHPGDSDYFSESESHEKNEEAGSSASGGDDAEDKKKECPYGVGCYRKNPQHKKDFKHTKKVRPQREAAKQAGKKTKSDEDDELDSYDLNDSFVNDDSDEYKPMDSGSDWDSGDDAKGLEKGRSAIKNKKAQKHV